MHDQHREAAIHLSQDLIMKRLTETIEPFQWHTSGSLFLTCSIA
jgi:hypothetical protein